MTPQARLLKRHSAKAHIFCAKVLARLPRYAQGMLVVVVCDVIMKTVYWSLLNETVSILSYKTRIERVTVSVLRRLVKPLVYEKYSSPVLSVEKKNNKNVLKIATKIRWHQKSPV